MTTRHTDPEQSDGTDNIPVVEHLPASETEAIPLTAGTATPIVETPTTNEAEEPIQPFSEFIKEFRQTEARFGSSLPEHHGGTQFMVPGITPFEVSTTTHQPIADASSTGVIPADVEAQSKATGDASIQESDTSKNDVAPLVPAPTPAPRPVSPLLRPATRQRMPRYTSGRRREDQPSTASEPAAAKPSSGDAMSITTEPVVTEPAAPAQEEASRPARRYRFDRPSASAAVTPTPLASIAVPTPAPVPPRVEESKETVGRTAPSHPVASRGTHEKNKPAPSSVQESAVAESSEATTTPVPATQTAPEHDRRRRYGQEKQQRGKAQTTTPAASLPAQPVPLVTSQAVAPVEEVVAMLSEAVIVQPEEISPEDLPPLEYAELQKANSHRRRRRHTNSSPTPVSTPTPIRNRANVTTSVSTHANVPEPPVVSPLPMIQPTTPAHPVSMPRPSAPVAPPSPVAPAGQYGITSGYTVSQMNQNGESTNAFMGPEPSPARGSIAAQNVRSIRTDVQRVPAYPVRPSEATSASVHQLANVVSQAIQTQTDRMIVELRRANQVPTNISVSLPPFPSTERVGVFVDVANLLYSARTLRMNVDFGKLLDFLRGNRRLVRAQAYCPTSPQPGDEQMFLQAVKGLGYRITTKNYKIFSSGAKKADLDLDLCMDVVRLVDGKAVDCVVLVSGDSDFMPMLDYCSDHGVRVEVAAFDEAMSATLRQGCDLFINLSMLEEIRA